MAVVSRLLVVSMGVGLLSWGCGTGSGRAAGGTSSSTPGGPNIVVVGDIAESPLQPGIYVGETTCDYRFSDAVNGLIDANTHSQTESISFVEPGVPEWFYREGGEPVPGGDVVEVFGLDVIRRRVTLTINEDGVSFVVEGDTDVNGTPADVWISFAFKDIGVDTIFALMNMRLDYRYNGIATVETLDCTGTLTR